MSRSQRKDDHMNLALKQTLTTNDFDLIRYYHHSFPELNFEDVDLSTQYLNHNFDYPFYINAMTGGSLKTQELNRKLALLAKKFNLMMIVGSQHAALDDPTLIESYSVVREVNPEGFIVANVNPNASVEEAQRAVDMIEADALSIHVNPAQELTMDEGDRNFSHWLDSIKKIKKALDVPVIVKEVGFGMSRYTINQLYKIGIEHVDVSGKGGTNFIQIENDRSEMKAFDYLQNWGLSTVESLFEAQTFMSKLEILASGGVRHPLDVVKALSLSASAVGMSGHFLRMAQKDEKSMELEMKRFIDDIKKIYLLLGVESTEKLRDTDMILEGRLKGKYEKK